MKRREYPILEYDPTRKALIEPTEHTEKIDIPEHCVVCFFNDVIKTIAETRKLEPIHHLKSEIGRHPIYQTTYNGKPIAFIHPGIGAPLAAGFLDEVIALGSRKFMVCGGAGVLDSTIPVGHVILPTSALRDEGTSYHYLPPSRTVEPTPEAITALEQTLTHHKVPYTKGRTWTTDAYYRETPDKIKLRKEEGCITVEMEASAFFAVAQFRDVALGQVLYGGDDVGSEEWDFRDWVSKTSVREKLFWVAAEACLKL